MDDDFFRREYELGPQKRDNLFLWTVFILLLTGAVIAIWLGSFYIFGHPEVARNYRLLMKLHKLEAPKRFEFTGAPPGDFFTPQKVYEKYATMGDGELAAINATLLRDYIRNYEFTKNPVAYLVGRFTILNLRELKPGDLFQSGMVALAKCSDYPQVMVEYVYTADATGVDDLKQTLAAGTEITPERTTELAAILHIEKLSDGRLLVTAIPIIYGSYTLKNGEGTFSLDPPKALHLEGGIPITKLTTIPPAGKNYAAHVSATPAEDGGAAPAASPAGAQLVTVMAPLPVSTPKGIPASGHATPAPTPAIAVATPAPTPESIATPPPVPVAQETPTPPMVALASPTPPSPVFAQNPSPSLSAPLVTPGGPTPLPSAVPDHPDVSLQPFIQSTPAITSAAGNWKTFRPGQMPRGRLLKIADTTPLADHDISGEPLYLSGQFVVTATSENHAVLRAKTGVLGALNPLDHTSSSIRVLVEFPAGLQPPAEGATVSRDELRPFEIEKVQREHDGTVDVIVREVTTPQ